MFCVSDDADFASNHMMLLAELAGKLGNDERVEKLQKVTTKQELIDLFLN
ncbi:MAG: PTS sugar transporter subunit IIA [Holdemania filiformis]